ncbi:hypothetical protein G5I_14444 [Acromyrmex echinatior]|uniref:Uncharacterized protein n=1 Tax=Acromyrmex echinatior TaxID=103372 RepID=F4X7R0_ACREC|nr:hypothetical protein G5I_14444 [Acromyrmex echinatior]
MRLQAYDHGGPMTMVAPTGLATRNEIVVLCLFLDTCALGDRSSLNTIPMSTHPNVRPHVYKINLLSDAIKYLSTGFPKHGMVQRYRSIFFILNSRRYGTKWEDLLRGFVVVCNFGMMHDRLLGECKLKTNIPQTTRYEGVWYKRRWLNGK